MERINQIMSTAYFAQRRINNIIYREEISPVLENDLRNNVTDPDWNKIEKNTK